jgi:sec-independent protein translocase protein TatB
MFEVGFTEIVLIFGIALLVLGPQRLPKLAADVGRWAGRARAMARQLKTQLEQETQFDPLADPKPARASGSNTIYPPPAPSDDARAAPAQLAAAAPLNPADEAALTPDKTATDEPKSV